MVIPSSTPHAARPGYFHRESSSSDSSSSDDDDNDERQPLSPQESTESFHTRTTTSYLAFFRSPSAVAAVSQRKLATPFPVEIDTDAEEEEEHHHHYVPSQYRISGGGRPSLSASTAMSNESTASGLSILSSSSHLFGEQVMVDDGDDDNNNGGDHHGRMDSRRSLASPTASVITTTSSVMHNRREGGWLEWKDNVSTVVRGVGQDLWRPVAQSFRMNNRSTTEAQDLSPRSRNLTNLHYLTRQNQAKLHPYYYSAANGAVQNEDDHGDGEKNNPQEQYNQDYYDFALVLQPQATYAYWATLLDFRSELLGDAVVQQMDQEISGGGSNLIGSAAGTHSESSDSHEKGSSSQSPGGSSTSGSSSSSSSSDDTNSEARDQVADIEMTASSMMLTATPSLRMRRKTNSTPQSLLSSSAQPSLHQQYPTPLRNGDTVSLADSRQSTIGSQQQQPRLSLFERATLGTSSSSSTAGNVVMATPDTLNRSRLSTWTAHTRESSMMMTTPAAPLVSMGSNVTTGGMMISTTGQQQRRRWGNHNNPHFHQQPQSKGFLSPPITSLTRGGSLATTTSNRCRPTAPATLLASASKSEVGGTTKQPPSSSDSSSSSGALTPSTRNDPNELTVHDIPNDRIPRGMVARTHYLSVFLSELRRGIVVRRHRPDKKPVFVKLQSTDGGDTIQHLHVSNEEATLAFREQRIRYNQNNPDVRSPSWSQAVIETEEISDHAPDYVAARRKRNSSAHHNHPQLNVRQLVTNKVVHRHGTVKVENLIVVHPATHRDPRHADYHGTIPLRQSNSTYAPDHTFSLVYTNNTNANLLLRPHNASSSKDHRAEEIEKAEQRWYEGSGNESAFRYYDLETATIGEYWLLLRGFLLLRRDAAVGRFAEHRAAGIGSHYSRLLEHQQQRQTDDPNRLHRDEFHEPVTVGYLEKLIVKWRKLDTTYMEGFTLEGAVPPPSDYFLGFKSPGTSIWSRLRLAGLQTQRVYSLDPRRVMIKVRCPSDRLMDVAEVLRLKLPTRDGTFAPFREDAMDLFKSQDEPSETPFLDDDRSFHFRSSIRQALIDFIISSRIRDSGAELGQSTDVGQKIQARVPLHMRAKVDAIYQTWAFFWRKENWDGRDGCSLSHEKFPPSSATPVSPSRSIADGSWESQSLREKEQQQQQPLVPPHRMVRIFKGCFHLPLDSIEEYFGEKIAFYFAWLQHTAFHLVWLAFAGFVMFLVQVTNGSLDHPLRPLYSFLVMMWTFLVLINWKKRANFLAYRWGTLDYKEQEVTRPEFQGDYQKDEITGEWVVTYPKWKRWVKYCISFPLTLLFTAGALVLILAVHANRDLTLAKYVSHVENATDHTDIWSDFSLTAITTDREFTKTALKREYFADPTFWFILIGMPALLGLCQPLLNFLLMKLSVALNDFENYRTVSEYRTHLIIKVIAFRFVCYFAHLYYYAFSSFGGEDAVANGLLRVSTGVAVYTTVAHWWQVFLQIQFPILIRKLRMYYRKKRLCEELRAIELEEEQIAELGSRGVDEDLKQRQVRQINKRLLLEQAQDDIWLEIMLPEHNSFAEYIQAVVLFTYVACFSAVLPITPLIVLFNYLVSMRLDAFKVCKGRRRPLAEKTGGIGVWEHLLHIVAVISVLTNCWLMGFTNSYFIKIAQNKNVGEVGLFAIIVGWEHVMLLIKYVMETSISTLPKNVKDAMKKEQYELDMQRNTSMRLRQGRRTQHERESLPHEDRTRGVWRNVPSIRLSKTVRDDGDDNSRRKSDITNASESHMCRAPIPDSDVESVGDGSASVQIVQTPRVGRSDQDQGIRTLFSA